MALADTNHGGDFEAADAVIFESLYLGLRRVISNIAIDGVRHEMVKNKQAHLVVGDTEAVDSYPSDLDILEMLSPIERAILLLIDVDGLRFNEVSRIVGISPVAARIRASRARKHLRQLLGDNQ